MRLRRRHWQHNATLQQYKGRGVTSWLKGDAGPAESASAYSKRGDAVHEAIEQGQLAGLSPELSSAERAMADCILQELKRCYGEAYVCEVFVHGTQLGEPVLGFIDAIGITEQGDLHLIDFKTTWRTKPTTNWQRQVSCYALLMHEFYELMPIKAQLWLVQEQGTISKADVLPFEWLGLALREA